MFVSGCEYVPVWSVIPHDILELAAKRLRIVHNQYPLLDGPRRNSQRQFDHEVSALSLDPDLLNGSRVLADGLLNDGQPETGSTRTGAKPWLEDLLLQIGRYSRTRVNDLNTDPLAVIKAPGDHGEAAALLGKRLDGILHHFLQAVQQVFAVTPEGRHVLGELQVDANAGHALGGGRSLAAQLVDMQSLQFQPRWLGELRELVDKGVDAAPGLSDVRQVLGRRPDFGNRRQIPSQQV